MENMMTFETGAVREPKDGKGSYNLLPPETCKAVINNFQKCINRVSEYYKENFDDSNLRLDTLEISDINPSYKDLYKQMAIESLYDRDFISTICYVILIAYNKYDINMKKYPFNNAEILSLAFKDLSIHFQIGTTTHGYRNFELLPYESVIDSGTRHMHQFILGEKDSNHHVACMWNLMVAHWKLTHEPEKCLPLKPVKYNKTESNNDSVTIDESVSEKCDDKCNELFDQELMEMTQSEILGMSYQYGFVLSQFTYDKNSFNFILSNPGNMFDKFEMVRCDVLNRFNEICKRHKIQICGEFDESKNMCVEITKVSDNSNAYFYIKTDSDGISYYTSI